MHFGTKSVKTLEDLKGLKLRAPTRIGSKTLAALGAIPVQMPAPAIPESIGKAVVDGASLPWEVTTSLKLQEIAKTTTEVPHNQPKHSNAIFRPGGVNLRACLCGVPMYAAAQPLDFLVRPKNPSFPHLKPIVSHPEFPDEH